MPQFSQALQDLGLGGGLFEGETEDERRKRLLAQQQQGGMGSMRRGAMMASQNLLGSRFGNMPGGPTAGGFGA